MIRRSIFSLKSAPVAQAMGARFASRWTAERIPMGPADPILGLNDAFQKVSDDLVLCHPS